MKEHEEEDVIDLWLPLQPRAGKKDKVQGKIHIRFLYSCSAVSILTCAFHDRSYYSILLLALYASAYPYRCVWVSQETKPTEDRGQQIFFYDDYIDSFKTGYSLSCITQFMTTRRSSSNWFALVACAAT